MADDHRGLPPALIICADHDPLLDDGRRYTDRLRSCGAPVQTLEVIDSPHGFFSFRSYADVPRCLRSTCRSPLFVKAVGAAR